MDKTKRISRSFDQRSHFYRFESAWADDDSLNHVCIKLLTEVDSKPVSGLELLDYGCGPGILSRQLSHIGYIVDVADISEEMLKKCEFARKKFNLPEYPLNDTYDRIILRQVLHYVEESEWQAFLVRILGYLNKKGRLLFSEIVPYCKVDYALWKEMVRVRRSYRMSFPTENEFLSLCEQLNIPMYKFCTSYTRQDSFSWLEYAPISVKKSIEKMFRDASPAIRALWDIQVDQSGNYHWTNRWVHILVYKSPSF